MQKWFFRQGSGHIAVHAVSAGWLHEFVRDYRSLTITLTQNAGEIIWPSGRAAQILATEIVFGRFRETKAIFAWY
jgi:hypothetical protein